MFVRVFVALNQNIIVAIIHRRLQYYGKWTARLHCTWSGRWLRIDRENRGTRLSNCYSINEVNQKENTREYHSNIRYLSPHSTESSTSGRYAASNYSIGWLAELIAKLHSTTLGLISPADTSRSCRTLKKNKSAAIKVESHEDKGLFTYSLHSAAYTLRTFMTEISPGLIG
ncbi:hypothetical protein J6590_056958 [Homalodisca vitripennis]|nr:hypothetical protein J6590_056958 [Homalodisca vitripennis]